MLEIQESSRMSSVFTSTNMSIYILDCAHAIIHYNYMQALSHPNILNFLGDISTVSSVTMITNFVRGSDLHNLIFNDTLETEVSMGVNHLNNNE